MYTWLQDLLYIHIQPSRSAVIDLAWYRRPTADWAAHKMGGTTSANCNVSTLWKDRLVDVCLPADNAMPSAIAISFPTILGRRSPSLSPSSLSLQKLLFLLPGGLNKRFRDHRVSLIPRFLKPVNHIKDVPINVLKVLEDSAF